MISLPARYFRKFFTLFFSLFALSLFFLNGSDCYGGVFSQARAKFYRGNTDYSEGKYDKAIAEYEGALSGLASGNLYYNLGNCYFKKGRLGEAILNYEKAMRLIPRDSDLKSNYRYARSLIKGGLTEAKAPWYRAVFDRIFSLFTIDELAFALSAIFTAICLIALIAAYIPAVKKYELAAIVILAVVFALSFIAISEKARLIGKEAVVVAQKTDAKFAPFDSATSHFTLYEGIKVRILSSEGSWDKIRRSDNRSGWVKASDLEIF